MNNLDIARVTREEFEIDAIEYVNTFFKDKAKDTSYLDELNKRADDYGVYQNLIMIDGEGYMASLDDKERAEAIENNIKCNVAANNLCYRIIRDKVVGDGCIDIVIQRDH